MSFLKLFYTKNLYKMDDIYFVPNFLTKKDCTYLMELLNELNFTKAHQFEKGRHNKEIFTENEIIKNIIISKIPKCVNKLDVKAISETFEFYKYEIGDFIKPHTDSSVELENGFNSNYTAIVYLNDNYFGGETYFETKNLKIKPESGALLLFKQELVHEALIVQNGTKLIYRSNWFIQKRKMFNIKNLFEGNQNSV